jgi:hypothetical protein
MHREIKLKNDLGLWTVKLLVSITTILVSACGGGESNSPGPSAEGVYGGALSGSTSSSFQGLVLENDEFWVLYGTQSSTTFLVAGFIQGPGTSSSGAFTSSGLKDYGVLPPLVGTASATYNANAKTINGSASFPGRTIGFNGGPIAGSLYNYDNAANLSTVSGAWVTTVNTGESANLSISPTGAISLLSSVGCSGTGNVAPRASGKNVFNVSLTFGPAPCALPGGTIAGIAIAYPLSNGRTQLIAGGKNSAQSAGFMIFGTR